MGDGGGPDPLVVAFWLLSETLRRVIADGSAGKSRILFDPVTRWLNACVLLMQCSLMRIARYPMGYRCAKHRTILYIIHWTERRNVFAAFNQLISFALLISFMEYFVEM